MLPSIDPAILERNPNFKILYDDLCKTRLHRQGPSKAPAVERQREEVRKKIQALQIQQHKFTILQDSLRSISQKAIELPPELLEVIHVVSAQLSGDIQPEDEEIIQDDINYFLESIPAISASLSTHLTTTLNHLAAMFHPETNPSKLLTSTLPTHARSLATAIESQTTSLAALRIDLSALAVHVLEQYRQATELAIRLLEQKAHGSVARHARAHAEHLAVVGEGMEMKLRLLLLGTPPDPHLLAALQTYSTHLRDTKAALQARERKAETALQQYDRAGGATMRELGEEYQRIREEMEEVKEEIARLQGKK